SPLIAVMLIGTSIKRSSRFCAVTTTSSSTILSSASERAGTASVRAAGARVPSVMVEIAPPDQTRLGDFILVGSSMTPQDTGSENSSVAQGGQMTKGRYAVRDAHQRIHF